MSLLFFLDLKRKNELLIDKLLQKNTRVDSKKYIQNGIKLNKIMQSQKYIHDRIYTLCSHDFVKDLIDITPDRSQEICYCTICECLKTY